jgi:hypothetical protein
MKYGISNFFFEREGISNSLFYQDAYHPDMFNFQAAEMLDRILRLLASYDVIKCKVEVDDDGKKMTRRYGPASVCKWLTKNEDGVSIAAIVLMLQDKALMECWYV